MHQKGFALVVTLSLMILLTVIAVGLLSLSAISLRSTSQGTAQAEARANARLALMIAIGELQKHAGPDTRVTAPSGIVDKSAAPLTGVWRSWEGADHETSGSFAGRPVTPDYAAKKKTAAAGGRFLTWLVSGAEAGASPDNPAALASKTAITNSVPLLSNKTLAAGDERQVHVVPAPVAGSGTFAWWVNGENQKARLPQPYQPENDTAADWSVIGKSHAVADPKPFGLDALLSDPAPAEKAITLATADLIAAPGATTKPRQHFLDLSTSSVGLLTNTATGGWRKDLSLLSESWQSQPASGLPLFQITPTVSSSATRPTSDADATSAGVMLYPWAEYEVITITPGINTWVRGAAGSWANLMDWATSYKRVSTIAGGKATTPIQASNVRDQVAYDFLHRSWVTPLIARVHWLFSHSAAKVSADPELFEPRLLMTPVVTLWNPYNVEIVTPSPMYLIFYLPLPFAFQYSIDGIVNPLYNPLMYTSASWLSSPLSKDTLSKSVRFDYRIMSSHSLQPGETRVLSPQSVAPLPMQITGVFNIAPAVIIAPGYRSGGGHYVPVMGPAGEQPLALPGGTVIQANARFDAPHQPAKTGVLFDVQWGGNRKLEYRMMMQQPLANTVYPGLSGMASAPLSQAAGTPVPFLSAVFGPRTASKSHMASKGFVQTNPFAINSSMGDTTPAFATYKGMDHPVNAPFDMSFIKHAPGGDSLLPNADATTNRGFIVTGFSKADGLTRCVITELPTRPLASLGELVNWDLRSKSNPVPPFDFNLTGNSDATPLLPANSAVAGNANSITNLQHDGSYVANHLLFDDWFVSSITPAPAAFGPTGGRSQEKVYTDFVSGNPPLPNHNYKPIGEDRAATDKTALYALNIKPADSWRKIASRLEVEGMFNVNSTSVTAWRALLGHARNQRVPYTRETGSTWDVGLSGSTNHPWSRFSVAGDSEAGTAGSSGAFPGATEFTGYRTVDDAFLDALAGEVVKQVRQRGPFLSLAEFVNRQLSSGDLALAGTIQAALNELSKNPSTDLFGSIKANSQTTSTSPPTVAGVTAGYQFLAAAAGYSSYGVPGWTRQADILRPLAPILSARDDTFTIRSYGDARDKTGKVVLARAWCEATVRRTRGFVDPAEAADLTTAPARPANQAFGRRFEIVSFRWLAPDEI